MPAIAPTCERLSSMIFGPDPSAILLIFLLAALAVVSAIGLLWVLVALLFARTRGHLRRNPRRYGCLVVVSLVFAGLGGTMWRDFQRIYAESEARQQALNPRLEAELRLGELSFPAGSQAHLVTLDAEDWQGKPQAHGLESLKAIELPEPQDVLGMPVSAIDFSPGYSESRLRLEQDRVIEDWSCAASEWVSFRREAQDTYRPSRWRFDQCNLVPGVHVAGVIWPAGTVLSGDRQGWMLRAEDADDLDIALDGLHLSSLRLYLDSQRRVEKWDGQLARPATLGEWLYPQGTRVRGDERGAWLFSPTGEHDAINQRTGEKVAEGQSILQRRGDTTPVTIKPNSEVGVIDWFVVTPAQ
ncbi:hypothetical protein NLK61_14970 [Pseudomonas fuscovaginae UPB0736]|uniref:hypothetical protein n=2 Tax=Pseudomonas asplenii TaxID=53407 RepID=UPI0003168A04|nr:hypothetical protein [Pseudomonas fuscovaginae]UUQ62602.1 hypothetical protein NLK61_14970 [Pseudomonas fuscovaginae UPB0736]